MAVIPDICLGRLIYRIFVLVNTRCWGQAHVTGKIQTPPLPLPPPPPPPHTHTHWGSKMVPLLRFFVRPWFHMRRLLCPYLFFLSSFWCPRRAVFRDCGISWISSLLFLCIVCHGLFTLPLGVIGRLCPVIVTLPGHFLHYQQQNHLSSVTVKSYRRAYIDFTEEMDPL